MTSILFVCHGNICRSPMAQFVMQDLVDKAHLGGRFHIESAAVSSEEIGNPVYRDVADPWYTGDFEATMKDVEQGCAALLKEVMDD